MNIQRLTRLVLSLILLILGLSCGLFPWWWGGGDSNTGYIYKYSGSSVQPGGTTTVSVEQRDDLFASIKSEKFAIDEKSGLYRADFKISGLTKDRSFVFRVSGNFQETLSFPFTISDYKVFLGGLDTALYNLVVFNVASTPYNLVIDNNKGVIIGVVNPLGLDDTICGSPIYQVELLNSQTGEAASGDIYYFTKGGVVSKTATVVDGYAIFNVAEGDYIVRFLTVDSTVHYDEGVVALGRTKTFGFQIPCQRFTEFKKSVK